MLSVAFGNVAYAENAVCVAQSCEGTYLAVATTGAASSSGGVAVSGTSTASGGTAAVSGTSRAFGPGENVSGEAFLSGTGLLTGPVNEEQLALFREAYEDIDPADLQRKVVSLAETSTWVALNMAEGAGPPPIEAPSSSSSASAASSGTPNQRALPVSFVGQERWYYCVPASLRMYIGAWGYGFQTSQDQWANALKTDHPDSGDPENKNTGTPIENTVPFINRYKAHEDRVYVVNADSPSKLMDFVTNDVAYYNHGMLLVVQTTSASWWSYRGNPKSGHAIVVNGYDHRNGGSINIQDPFDITRWNWDTKSWGRAGNPGGNKWIRLADMWAAAEPRGGRAVW